MQRSDVRFCVSRKKLSFFYCGIGVPNAASLRFGLFVQGLVYTVLVYMYTSPPADVQLCSLVVDTAGRN